MSYTHCVGCGRKLSQPGPPEGEWLDSVDGLCGDVGYGGGRHGPGEDRPSWAAGCFSRFNDWLYDQRIPRRHSYTTAEDRVLIDQWLEEVGPQKRP